MDKEKKGEERRKENKRERRERSKQRERERERERREKKEGDFPGVPMVRVRRFEKKSRSKHRELRVGTKILEFRQAPRGREFSSLEYF